MRVGHDAGAVLTTPFDPVDAVLPIRALRATSVGVTPAARSVSTSPAPIRRGRRWEGNRYGA